MLTVLAVHGFQLLSHPMTAEIKFRVVYCTVVSAVADRMHCGTSIKVDIRFNS